MTRRKIKYTTPSDSDVVREGDEFFRRGDEEFQTVDTWYEFDSEDYGQEVGYFNNMLVRRPKIECLKKFTKDGLINVIMGDFSDSSRFVKLTALNELINRINPKEK